MLASTIGTKISRAVPWSAQNTSWGWLDTHYTAITPSGVISLTHIFNPSLVFQGTMGFSQFSEDGSPLKQSDLVAKERSTVGFTIPQLYPSVNVYNSGACRHVWRERFGQSGRIRPAFLCKAWKTLSPGTAA